MPMSGQLQRTTFNSKKYIIVILLKTLDVMIGKISPSVHGS